jgi:hypothetical protein
VCTRRVLQLAVDDGLLPAQCGVLELDAATAQLICLVAMSLRLPQAVLPGQSFVVSATGGALGCDCVTARCSRLGGSSSCQVSAALLAVTEVSAALLAAHVATECKERRHCSLEWLSTHPTMVGLAQQNYHVLLRASLDRL